MAKSYLNLLVDEIIVKEHMPTMKGSYQAIAYVAQQDKTEMGHSNQVPTFMDDWCAREDESGHWIELILIE